MHHIIYAEEELCREMTYQHVTFILCCGSVICHCNGVRDRSCLCYSSLMHWSWFIHLGTADVGRHFPAIRTLLIYALFFPSSTSPAQRPVAERTGWEWMDAMLCVGWEW